MWPHFSKWEGTGNDFILVDDRKRTFPAVGRALIERACDRHFGVGSDGLILVQPPIAADTAYHMAFYNPDGSTSFCGNGSRCAFAFWRTLQEGPVPDRARFTASDGEHDAALEPDGMVSITLRSDGGIERIAQHIDLIRTGSPHLVVWVQDPGTVDLLTDARELRYSPRFKEAGVNVNFVTWRDGCVVMRTYERGVEGETLSCGTGVAAAAISARHRDHTRVDMVPVETRGGSLRVMLAKDREATRLIGPAREVFKGTYID